MMKLGTYFLFVFSILDCFEFFFQFTIEMIMVQIWIVYHFDRFYFNFLIKFYCCVEYVSYNDNMLRV
jgi:hypothetical protein